MTSPTARQPRCSHASQEGDIIVSNMPAPRAAATARPVTPRAVAQLAILEQTYPRWQIRRRPTGMWTATRVITPTAAQAAAGLQRYLLLPTLDALAAVLCEQFLIAQTIR